MLAAVAAGALMGCAGGPPAPAAVAPTDRHTMGDGSVMAGAEHSDHAEHGGQAGHGASADAPSTTASMVCGGDVAADLERLLGLDQPPASSWSWSAPLFECSYDTPVGPVVLTVHDAMAEADGRRWFRRTRAELAPTRALRGIYSLGLPAFETGRGTSAFIRDGKTLVVDATAARARTGPDGEMDRAELAYAVATSVLACWTDHA